MSLTDSELSDIGVYEKDEPNQQDTIPEIKTPEKKVYPCLECGEIFDTPIAKATHTRVHHPKEKSSLKEAKEGKEPTHILPENLAFLRNVLKSFGAKGAQNILDGMADNPSDLTELRDLLGANENKANVPYILKRYSNYAGIPLPEEKTSLPLQTGFGEMYGMAKQGMEIKMMQNLFGETKNNDNNTNKSNPEFDSLKTIVLQLQKSNEALQQQLTQQRTDAEIASLRKQLDDNQRTSGGAMGSLTESMSSFATSMTHLLETQSQENNFKFEKLLTQMQHQTETDALKKQIQEASSNKPLQEKMMDKVENLANNVAMGTGQIFDKAVKSQDVLEKANMALMMKQSGFDTGTISGILNPQPQRTLAGSAKSEYENLAKITDEINTERNAQIQDTAPAIEPQKPIASVAEEAQPDIKFNASDA